MLFVDQEKIFDIVDRNILLETFENYGQLLNNIEYSTKIVTVR